MSHRSICTLASLALVTAASGCSSDSPTTDSSPDAHTLFVAHAGTLVSYDLDTGKALPGTIPSVDGPTDIQALHNGHLLVNLTDRNEVLALDGATMLELARIPASNAGAVRPVHSYLTPERDGKQYWV